MDANAIADLLLRGSYKHSWQLFGREVTYEIVPVGTLETIQRASSGLDPEAKSFVMDVLSIAHHLVHIGGYDFNNSLDEKLKIVRAMKPGLFALFRAELDSAKIKAQEEFEKVVKDLKV